MKYFIYLFVAYASVFKVYSQVDENQTGAWYMYFYNHQFKDSQWGIQGDFQYRDWQVLGDTEQLLLRSGLTYTPKDSGIMFTLGVANITTGQFGDSDETSNENRIYQEALIQQTIARRFLITHRFRYEQRFVESQDFRTRYRYNLFVNVPFNSKSLAVPKTIYGAFYNELFMNGERNIGGNRNVELFDRNRTYFGLGYVLNKKVRFQMGWMNQTTNAWSKGQLQFSMHHNF
ncbi:MULTISPECIES: DUF2490 domain-containing protein [unclassified Polaribacter]|uniref:DUF2490 domain-containing protein n=1 Tax=unclassified Polaribacter TaxID=196858 RepID=UPI0011BE05AB|nr:MULTISPECIES: DUF2490 domain-containing protein [unclassified Polaribacter]TXD51351.1 DUF2490 domain-containing protein [Polaribacter sp. IC063]TXD61985.1 DUF2490 domain-containing protein [Polaribacter sp. IC066]